MRRTHLQEHENILKRLLFHVCAFNLGLVMRRLIGIGTPRALQGLLDSTVALLRMLVTLIRARFDQPAQILTPKSLFTATMSRFGYDRDRQLAPGAAPISTGC